jgi:hypothetical protein
VRYFSEAETHDGLVCRQEGVHVGMKTLQGVDGGQIKLHFNEIIWIRLIRLVNKERLTSNDEVDIVPV